MARPIVPKPLLDQEARVLRMIQEFEAERERPGRGPLIESLFKVLDRMREARSLEKGPQRP